MVNPIIQLRGLRLPISNGRAPWRVSLALTVMLGSACAQAQDEYLMQLESDLDGIVVDEPFGDRPATASVPTSAVGGRATAATSPQQEEFLDSLDSEIDGMSAGPGRATTAVPEDPRAQFDSDLRDRMPGTFVLYRRLPGDKKDLVFEEYQMSGDYLRVRRKIIELRRRR